MTLQTLRMFQMTFGIALVQACSAHFETHRCVHIDVCLKAFHDSFYFFVKQAAIGTNGQCCVRTLTVFTGDFTQQVRFATVLNFKHCV
jgi:hypothetical protein